MKKQGTAILLILSLLLMCLSAAYAEDKSFTLAGYDSNTGRQWDTNLFFTREKEATGIQFSFDQYSDRGEWKKAVSAMHAGEKLPDAFFMAELTGAECIRLISEGVLIDLAPYIGQYCPNLSALIDKYPEILDAITLPDGTIAALPYVNETPMNCGIWVNTKWLNALRLEMPTDLASFENMLRMFLQKDPNRNGKQDEVPLAYLGTFDLKFLAHAWGLTANDYNVFLADDGTVGYMPLQPEYRAFVEWCRGAYKEGLLDPDGFTTADTLRTVSDANSAQRYGAVITTTVSTIFPREWIGDYQLMMPLTCNGRQVYRDYFGHVKTGTFAVTSACTDVAGLLSWVDRLYSYDVAVQACVGLENKEYTRQGNGRWHLINESNAAEVQAAALLTGGSAYPGFSCDDFQSLYYDSSISDQLNAYDALNNVASRPFPYYMLTGEQEKTITPLQNQLGRLVDMQTARWITGEDELTDASYEQFTAKLSELGVDAFIAFWQDIAR